MTLSQLFTRSSDLESNEFEKCFIPPVVEELRLEIMCLLSPLIRDDSESKNLNRWWRKLFEDALRFRVRCYPPAGTRYEIVQYKPGDFFDPEVMEVHDAAGIPVHMADDGEKHHVKLCMHGLIKSYTVDEVSSGIDLIKELSQPFYPEGVRHGGKDGETITSKAIVMLE